VLGKPGTNFLDKRTQGALFPPLGRNVAPVMTGPQWCREGGIHQIEPATQPVRLGLIPLQEDPLNEEESTEPHERLERRRNAHDVVVVPWVSRETVAVVLRPTGAALVSLAAGAILVEELRPIQWHEHLLDVPEHVAPRWRHVGPRDLARPEDFFPPLATLTYSPGLWPRFPQVGERVAFGPAGCATQGEVLQVNHDPALGIGWALRWWGFPQAQHLVPAPNVVVIGLQRANDTTAVIPCDLGRRFGWLRRQRRRCPVCFF